MLWLSTRARFLLVPLALALGCSVASLAQEPVVLAPRARAAAPESSAKAHEPSAAALLSVPTAAQSAATPTATSDSAAPPSDTAAQPDSGSLVASKQERPSCLRFDCGGPGPNAEIKNVSPRGRQRASPHTFTSGIRGKLRFCYKRGLARGTDFFGEVDFTLAVDGVGVVSQVKTRSRDGLPQEMRNCIEHAAKGIVFSVPQGADWSVESFR